MQRGGKGKQVESNRSYIVSLRQVWPLETLSQKKVNNKKITITTTTKKDVGILKASWTRGTTELGFPNVSPPLSYS